jgi:hypothetical protein
MPNPTCPIVGSIVLTPTSGADCRWRPETDDSTLQLLLNSFAHLPELHETVDAPRLVASTRWTCTLDESAADDTIRADLARLLADLQAEYDQLAGQLPC